MGAHALYCQGHAFRLFRELGVPFTGRFPSPGRGLLVAADVTLSNPDWHRIDSGRSRLLIAREKWRLARFLTAFSRLDTRPYRWRHACAIGSTGRPAPGNLSLLLGALFRVSTYCDDP